MYLVVKELNLDATQITKQTIQYQKVMAGVVLELKSLPYNTYIKKTKLEIIYGLQAMLC